MAVLSLLLLMLQSSSSVAVAVATSTSLFTEVVIHDLHHLLSVPGTLTETVRFVHLGQVDDEEQAGLIRWGRLREKENIRT